MNDRLVGSPSSEVWLACDGCGDVVAAYEDCHNCGMALCCACDALECPHERPCPECHGLPCRCHELDHAPGRL